MLGRCSAQMPAHHGALCGVAEQSALQHILALCMHVCGGCWRCCARRCLRMRADVWASLQRALRAAARLPPSCQLWKHLPQPLAAPLLYSFKKVHYTIEALFPSQDYGPLAPPTEALRSLEEQLVNKREALQHFETEYMQVGRSCLHCCLNEWCGALTGRRQIGLQCLPPV